MLRVLLLLYTLILVQANTETHILRVPKYFEIPKHPELFQKSQISPLNNTHSIIFDYPITTKFNYNVLPDTIEMQEALEDQQSKSLLIRINNYGNNTYNSNDLLFIKCCWPATYPLDIQLEHAFIDSSHLQSGLNTFDIYLVINYKADFKTFVSNQVVTQPSFKVVVEKLPNKWIPIPLEVYDIIVYIADVVILLRHLIPLLYIDSV